MSSGKSSGGAKKPPGSSAKSGSGKKSKSKGFIESADFKPNWLETGPLGPEMLPEQPEIESQTLADEFAALQAALQRYYGTESAEKWVEEDTPPAEGEPEQPPPTNDANRAVVDVADAVAAPASSPIEPPAAAPAVAEPPRDRPAPTRPAEPLPDPINELPWLEELIADFERQPDLPLEPTPARTAETAALQAVTAPLVEPLPSPVEHRPAATPEPEPFDQHFEITPEPAAYEATAKPELIEELPSAKPEPTEFPEAWQPLPDAAGAPSESWQSPFTAELPPLAEAEMALPEPEALALAPETLAPDWSTPSAEPEPLPAAPPPARKAARPRRTRQKSTRRRPSRLATTLFVLSLLLLGTAAFIYFVNPFTRLALGTATLARPTSSPSVAAPRNASGDWCLQADFVEGAEAARLVDNGSAGDILAQDNVFSLQYPIASPGQHLWQVADCADSSIVYPPAPSWVSTDQPGQEVTFIFDSTERADPLFFPIAYVVSALDGTENYRLVGSFQDWDPNDPSGQLQRLNSGLYQQVRRIARSGSYEAYIIAGDGDQAIDAYGRTTDPLPFSFETAGNSEYAVFLLDIDRGRASVLYGMPPLLTRLAFGNGYQLLSAFLAGVALLLLTLLLLRALALRNPKLWIESGCPRCHEQELMRIARRGGDRFLHLLGIPAYRYRCRNCTWEGRRLSETGMAVSPGARIARIDPLN